MRRKYLKHGGMGWLVDRPDHDFLYAAPYAVMRAGLPPATDLRPQSPPIWDQGQLGSCVGQGVGYAVHFDWKRQNLPDVTPSRLFIYYNARVMEHTTSIDAGCTIRDGIKVIAKFGAPHEHEWPYVITRFAVKPTANAYTDALLRQSVQYWSVTKSTTQIKACLAEGFPVIFGCSVFESFESDAVANTGVVPLPARGEENLGGHCMAIVGHDDHTQRFVVRNSWGPGWGIKGYCTMPYSYITGNLSSSFWTIRLMEATTT